MTKQPQYDTTSLEQYLSPTGRAYPNPTNMILVVDPSLVPGEVLASLLTPSGDDDPVALLTDRPFRWYPPDKSRFEIELRANNWLCNGSCAICGGRTDPGGLDPFWEGRDVCNVCMPDELVELQGMGYDYADEVSKRYPEREEAAWWEAIHEYARKLNGDRPS